MSKAITGSLAAFLAVLAVAPTPVSADAAERLRCLSRQEQRLAIANKAAVPLGRVVRGMRKRGDLLRARLCRDRNGGLVYKLTVLSRDGKVTRTTVDAANGRLIGSR